jgi:hypothetical protein
MIIRKTIELEIEKRIVWSSTEIGGVTGHCGVVGPIRNKKKRDIKSTTLRTLE